MPHVHKAVLPSIVTLLLSACTATPAPFLTLGKGPSESVFCKKYECAAKPPYVTEKEGNTIRYETYTLAVEDAPTLKYNHFDFRVYKKQEEFSTILRWSGDTLRTSDKAQEMVNELINSSIGSKETFKLIDNCVTLSRATEIFEKTQRNLVDQQVSFVGADGRTYKVGCILFDNTRIKSMDFSVTLTVNI